MTVNKETPKITPADLGRGYIETHPAYGSISVTRWTNQGGVHMFGSNLGHNNYVSITIREAELHRDLHRDHVQPRKVLVEFRMTDAQWASLVSSSGVGTAVPITLERVNPGDTPLVRLPEIEPYTNSRKEQFDEEFESKVRDALDRLKGLVKDLEEISEQKTISKKSLKAALCLLNNSLENLPSNLKFAVSSFQETTGKMVEDAKAEVESFIMTATQKAGLEALRSGALPELSAGTSNELDTPTAK